MKKILSAFLVIALLISLTAAVSAASGKTYFPSDVKETSSSGVSVSGDKINGWNTGGYVGFGEVDFTGIKSVRIKANITLMGANNGEAFRLYIDDPLKGDCIGYIVVNEERNDPVYYGVNIEGVSGLHKLYLKQNYSHIGYLYVYELVLSEEKWVDPKAVTPVPDDKIIDNYSDTWTAVGQNGKKIADYEETGAVKDGTHEVGMFYHDWRTDASQVYIPTDIIEKYPEAKDDFFHEAWPSKGSAWWGEPVYGFYIDTDYWHYRKAAELMADAGIDVLFLDETNGDYGHIKALDVMMRAYHDAREDGIDVPKISCYLQMGTKQEDKWRLLKAVYFNLCYNEYYKDLWYYWDGKPLLIQTGYAENVKAANQEDTEEVKLANMIIDFFTFRQTGNRHGGNPGKNGYWHWLCNYPQPKWGVTEDGRTECVNVGMAINESYLYKSTRVGVFSEEFTKGKSYTESFGEDYRPEAVHEGYFFREQASRVLSVDPEFAFVDGWNEWNTARGKDYFGVPNAFIDLYSVEKSRDFEPSNTEIKDDYYLMLVDFIRKYKGVRPAPVASGETVIDINAGAEQWESVEPMYINDFGDYERDAVGYKKYKSEENYEYKTEVVNSFSRLKVARDSENLYFMALCEKDIKLDEKDNMNLYINADRNYSTGWEGYDYVIGASGAGVVSKLSDGEYKLTDIGNAEYAVSGNMMTVKVSKALVGYTGEFEFKWTDNIEQNGNLMLFYTEGNAAPVGRFNYLYTEVGQTALTDSERAALSGVSVLKAGAGKMIVNGGKMNVYDKDLRVTCYEENGTLYIPAIAAEEILGNGQSKITYDSSLNMLYLEKSELTLDDEIDYQWACNVFGSTEIRIDGKVGYTGNVAAVNNGIIYVPATMIADCFGLTVMSLGDGAYAIGEVVSQSAAMAALEYIK